MKQKKKTKRRRNRKLMVKVQWFVKKRFTSNASAPVGHKMITKGVAAALGRHSNSCVLSSISSWLCGVSLSVGCEWGANVYWYWKMDVYILHVSFFLNFLVYLHLFIFYFFNADKWNLIKWKKDTKKNKMNEERKTR